MDNLNQLFVEAGTLMLAGMVFVFAFLGILVVFINQVLLRLAKKFPDPVVQSTPRKPAVQTNVQSSGVSPQVVAAIGAAVQQYRNKNSK